jgi:porphobilinogen deaminase
MNQNVNANANVQANATIRIATRGSALALAQAHAILAQCQAAQPGQSFEIVIIKTTGDKLQTASLSSGDIAKGLFTKELETALLEGQADLAVHSLKDLPTELPPGLALGAVTERADVRDVLIYRHIEYVARSPEGGRPVQQIRRGFKPEMSIASLPHRATIGTSSTRRTAQLQERRPDLRIVPLRGNVGTRLRKLDEQPALDAIVLAAAGLSRLHLVCPPGGVITGPENDTDLPEGLAFTPLPLSDMLPCVGQAAIALEIRENDPRLKELCATLNHRATFDCISAERSLLAGLGGGCHMAVGAFARIDAAAREIILQAVSHLGPAVRRAAGRAPIAEAEELGRRLAAQLRG